MTVIIKDIKNHEKDIELSTPPTNPEFHQIWEDMKMQPFHKGDILYLNCAMVVRGVYYNFNHNKKVVYVEYKYGFMECDGEKWFPENTTNEVKNGKSVFFPRRKAH